MSRRPTAPDPAIQPLLTIKGDIHAWWMANQEDLRSRRFLDGLSSEGLLELGWVHVRCHEASLEQVSQAGRLLTWEGRQASRYVLDAVTKLSQLERDARWPTSRRAQLERSVDALIDHRALLVKLSALEAGGDVDRRPVSVEIDAIDLRLRVLLRALEEAGGA